MVAHVEQGLRGGARAAEALAALADGAAAIGGASSLRDALGSVAETLVEATGAELAIVYVAERGEPSLVAVGVASVSAIVAAEVEGTRFPAAEPALAQGRWTGRAGRELGIGPRCGHGVRRGARGAGARRASTGQRRGRRGRVAGRRRDECDLAARTAAGRCLATAVSGGCRA